MHAWSRRLLATAAGALTLMFTSSTASDAASCAPRRGEHVAARSAQATLLLGDHARTLFGCSRRTGHRRFMTSVSSSGDGLDGIAEVALRGAVAVYVETQADRYSGWATLYLDDAVHEDRRAEVSETPFADVAFTAQRQVAWIERRGGVAATSLWQGGVARRLDRGRDLAAPHFTRTSVTWRHGGERRTAPLSPRELCRQPTMWGTAEVDVNQRADTTIACWRATGTTRTLAGARPGSLDIAGSWVSGVTADGRIVRVELVGGATDAIDAGDVGRAVIDAGGSVAWVGVDDDHSVAQLWFHDATGTHLIDAGTSASGLGFDGSTLIWGDRSSVLSP